MSVDSIGNFLTSIRNAIARASRFVRVPYSKFKYQISLIMLEEGFVKSVHVEGEGIEKSIVIFFKYVSNESVIHEIKQVSKPGRRVYVKFNCLPIVIGGLGIAILTTSQGIMTNKKLKEKNIGGELICTIW
jgi:small subunit ribosomal protein S8